MLNLMRLWRAALAANRYTWIVTVLFVGTLSVVATALAFGAEQRKWANHAVGVRGTARRMEVAVAEAGSAARGALLAAPGETDYRADYDAARATAYAALDDLRALTADNPSQQARLGLVRVELDSKCRELNTLISLQEGGRSGAVGRFRSGVSRMLHERVVDAIEEVISAEDALAAARYRVAELAHLVSVVLLVFLTGFTAFVVDKWRVEYRDLNEPPPPPLAKSRGGPPFGPGGFRSGA